MSPLFSLARETPVYAIHGPEASSEAAMIDNLTALVEIPPPLHLHLLGNASTSLSVPLREQQAKFPHELLAEMIEEAIDKHALNDDQATVMRSLSSWCVRRGESPYTELSAAQVSVELQ